jgi:tRNA U34 5-methylaminomethyl-2-thiouridine-forming methyltransferase MnmC
VSTHWVPVRTDDGSWTLLASALAETCHSRAGAWQQACLRYADGCRLRARASEPGRSVLRLLDVGTGLGLNLAAALEATHASGVALEVLTLEQDPDVIREGCRVYEACEREDGPGPWEPWHRAIRTALVAALAAPGAAVPLGAHGRLELALGDARVELERAAARDFDAVFLDPFSPRRAPELWQEPFLGNVAERMARGAWLATYSASFLVRLALARVGLHVGQGPRVGSKAEGTLAARDVAPPPLPERVTRRLTRALAGSREGRGSPF